MWTRSLTGVAPRGTARCGRGGTRVGGRGLLVVLLWVALAGAARSQSTSDGVVLSVAPGPGPLEMTLSWTGGQPWFGVYRATSPSAVIDPANLLGETLDRTWVDLPPDAPIVFYVITSPCVYSPPEVCDGLDNDCDGSIDEDTFCEFGCNTARGACNECDPLVPSTCTNQVMTVCGTAPPDDGRIVSTIPCAYGCAPAGDACIFPDTCAAAYPILGPSFGPASFADDMSNYGANVAGSCGAAGDDVIHAVDIPPAGGFTTFATIVMDSTGSSIDTALHLSTRCGDPTGEPQYASSVCGASIGSGQTCANVAGGTETLRACGMPAGTYFATLDSTVSTGAFTLTLTLDEVNLDTCREAGNVSNGPVGGAVAYVNSTSGKTNDYRYDLTSTLLGGCLVTARNACGLPNGDPTGNNSICGSDGGAASPDVVFYYRARTSGFLTLDTQGSSFDTILYLKSACAPGCAAPNDCLVCNDDHNLTQGSWSRIYRRAVTAGALYYIVVDGYGGDQGDFRLNVLFESS